MQFNKDFYKACFLFITFTLFLSSSQRAQAQIVIEPTILLSINGAMPGGQYYNGALGPSKFSDEATIAAMTQGYGSPSQNYIINGAIYTNCNREVTSSSCGNFTINATVSPTRIIFQNGLSQIAVDLYGQIGGEPISSSPRPITNFQRTNNISTLPWQASITIIGDVDESTISLSDDAGTYVGNFTIEAIIP
jgi:hypothetical protein